MSDAKNVEIEVIDVLGRSIYQKNESNTEGSKLLTINTLDWLSGIYFLKVSDGKKVFQQKIVKR
jgi:Secretion system C-terminal sorting domain